MAADNIVSLVLRVERISRKLEEAPGSSRRFHMELVKKTRVLAEVLFSLNKVLRATQTSLTTRDRLNRREELLFGVSQSLHQFEAWLQRFQCKTDQIRSRSQLRRLYWGKKWGIKKLPSTEILLDDEWLVRNILDANMYLLILSVALQVLIAWDPKSNLPHDVKRNIEYEEQLCTLLQHARSHAHSYSILIASKVHNALPASYITQDDTHKTIQTPRRFVTQSNLESIVHDSGSRTDQFVIDTTLFVAVKAECPDLVRYCIREGANAVWKDFSDWTLLHHAVFHLLEDVFDVLITIPECRNATYLNARTNTGETALIFGARQARGAKGCKLAIKLLQQVDCDANAHGKKVWMTPLYYATSGGRDPQSSDNPLVKALLEKGATHPTMLTLEVKPPVKFRDVTEHVISPENLESDLSGPATNRSQTTDKQTLGQLKRVEWICICGSRLWDDYIEIVPGSLSRLEERLIGESTAKSLWITLKEWSGFSEMSSSGASEVTAGNTVNLPANQPSQQSTSTTQLPANDQMSTTQANTINNPGNAANSTSQGHTTPPSPPPSVLYLLLCFPVGFSGLRLHHVQIIARKPQNDRYLFELLREVYSSRRKELSFSSILSLRTVTRVSLSHFLVDLSEFVDLKPHSSICTPAPAGCRCIPPASMIAPAPSAEYSCDPAQPEYTPPIGVNYLTHLFQNPTHVHERSDWVLRQVPKRSAGQLMAGPMRNPTQGWGVAFEEGWDRRRIVHRVFGLVILGALLLGILYSKFKKDIQSAFTISGFVVSILAVIGAYLGAGEARGFIHE